MFRASTVAFVCAISLGVAFHHWLNRPAFVGNLQPPSVSKAEAVPHFPTNRTSESNRASEEEEEKPVASPEPAILPVVARASPTPALAETLNLLLVGVDRRPRQKYGGRPDTIVIAAIAKNGHLGLISVPRDLYVEVPGRGMDRINATFSAAYESKQDPLKLLQRVIEDTLALPIAHRLALDLGGFESLIDALGGVDVDVPCPISDNFIDERSETGRRLLSVDAGLQHLDGKTAGLYVRSRHGRSDFSRARRQQAILFAIKRRFQSADGLTRIPEFIERLSPLITSDMTRSDVLHLARRLAHLEPENIHGLVLGAEHSSPHYTEDRKAVLLPNHEAISQSLAELFAADTPGKRPKVAPCPRADVALLRTRKSPAAKGTVETTNKMERADE